MKIITKENGDEQLIIETEDDVLVLTGAYKYICDKFAPIATSMLNLKGIDQRIWGSEIYYDYDDDGFYAEYTIESYGDYRDTSIYIPDCYLFDENFQENMTEKIEKIREDKRLVELERKKKAEEELKKHDYEQYLKLKNKFEGETE